jgi:hypothetical protein
MEIRSKAYTMDRGVLYIASGSSYIEEAIASAESIKSHADLPVTLVADRSVDEPCFDTVIEADDFQYHYGDSVLQIPELPYQKTLLLDTDTIISDDIEELFELIEQFDIAAATIADSEFTLSTDVPESFPEYNTGVVLFNKNEQTTKFIDEWKSVYRTYLNEGVRMNQPSFREVLYRSELRVATLPTEYNCRGNFGGYLNKKVKILHGSFDDPEAVLQELNRNEIPRLFFTTDGEIHVKRVETVNPRVFN